jgi:hypothetical protein
MAETSVKTITKQVQGFKETIRQMDPGLEEESPQFDAALLMLSALSVGTRNLRRLSLFTEVPYEDVRRVARRLREAGVWTQDGKTVANWDSPSPLGEIAFWTDVNVATGIFLLSDERKRRRTN